MTVSQTSQSPAPLHGEGPDPAVAPLDYIRAQFPALQRHHGGALVAYFDGPGGTQVPRQVVDAMADYLQFHNANAHWNYPSSAETDATIAAARAALADFLGAEPDEIVFGANATTLAFHASRALAQQFTMGDQIVVTELDHHANVGPWQVLARERDCSLRMVRMDTATGQLDWDDFTSKVNGRTRLVAIGAACNALGTISDVGRAIDLARSVGALTFVDAVHYAPHRIPDLRAWDCDFLVCSPYKFYGPHLGVMAIRRALLDALPFAKIEPSPNESPARAETGTLSHEGLAGAAAAIDFLASLAPGRPSPREALAAALEACEHRAAPLATRLWEGLASIDGVTVYGPPPGAARTPTIAFTVAGVPSSEVGRRLGEQALFVSHGNFYAATVVDRLGLGPEGLVRAGCALYTTADEVERLVAAVQALA